MYKSGQAIFVTTTISIAVGSRIDGDAQIQITQDNNNMLQMDKMR